eukprot:1085830-Amphidinium_carterae.1
MDSGFQFGAVPEPSSDAEGVVVVKNHFTNEWRSKHSLLSRTDMCSLRHHMEWRACVEAVVEHMTWLLYPKLSHYAFTLPACYMLKNQLGGRGLKLSRASVLLSYTWLVVTLFGPCLPITNALIALMLKIYSALLFGSQLQILHMPDGHEQSAIVPDVG